MGARVESRPSIALLAPQDDAPRQQAVGRLADYDWVVFTSRNGVRHFLVVLEEAGVTRDGIRAAAIGKATATALEEAGIAVALVAARSDSVGLGEALAARVRSGERILHVRPEGGDDRLPATLRAAGGSVDSVPFYRNAPAPGVELLAGDLCAGRFDIVILTSPSSLERLLESAEPPGERVVAALRKMALVALGPTTAGAIRERGLRVAALADEPTDEAVFRALQSL